MKIPRDNRWTQTNEGTILGVLHETNNITLERPGTIKLSRKPFAIYTSDDSANLGDILNISYFNNSYIALTSDELFNFDINANTVTEIASSPSTTQSSDAQVVYGRYYITTDTTTDYWDGSSWAGNQESLTTGVPHPMTVFDSLATFKLAIGNGNSLKLIDSSGNLSGTNLTLPAQYQITTLRYRNGYLYVGTKHLNGGEAKVFAWDGNTTNANYEIPTGSTWVFSMCEYLNTIALITEKGQLLAVNGTEAIQLGAFPVYYDPYAIWQGSGGLTLNGKVMHRGMTAVGNTIYINVDGDLDSGFIPEMKSGIWVYDPQTGLNHRAYHSVDKYVRDSSLSVTSSVITTSAAHNLKDGDAVQFRTVNTLTGVDTSVKYYVSVQSTTSFKIALSRKALLNNNFVTIGGTASTDSLVYVPNTDWKGGTRGTQGAIALTTPDEAQLDMWESPVVWGARFEDLDGNTFYALQCFTDSFNIGQFSTQKIYSTNIKEVWEKVIGFVTGILSENEEAILKYKKEDAIGYPTQVYQGVWAAANEIHSNSSTFDEDEWDDIEVGDELNIYNGYGRGYTCHVIEKNVTSNTFVLVVDENIGTAEKPVYFYADNYRKIGSITSDREEMALLQWPTDAIKSTFIQYKVELRGFEPEILMLNVQNSADK